MRRRDGFTLLEVLAVVLLTALVIGVALDSYVNLSRATERASSHSSGVRRAVSLLDRIARDFESVILIAKPPEMDPESHPWIFAGEQRYSELGADQLKFITLAHRPRGSVAHESNLLTVVYCLRNSEDGDTFDLLRWTSPQLPEAGSDLHEMPCNEERGARLLGETLYDFGVTFFEEGEETRSWDSTQLVDSGELPQAVQIQLAFADDQADEDSFEDVPRLYSRTVPIRVRPLDREELFDPASIVNGGDGSEGGEDPDEGDEDGDETACEDSPCADRKACDGIECGGVSLGPEVDGLIEQARGMSFCEARALLGSHGTNLIKDECL